MTYADKLEKLADEAEQGCGCSETFHKLRCAYVEAKDDLGMAGYSKPSQARKVAALVRALELADEAEIHLKLHCGNALCGEYLVLAGAANNARRKALADIEGEGGAG